MVMGRFSGDWATARIGAQRLTKLATVTAGIGLAAATLVPGSVGLAQSLSFVGYLVAGLGVAVLFPRLYDTAARAPGRPGVALGAMTAGSRLGVLATPVLVGVLADTETFTVGTALAAVTLPCALLLFVLQGRIPSGERAGSTS